MKKIILGGLLMGLAVTNAFSDGMVSAGSAIAADESIVPQSAFFGGLGGGWSSGSFGNQDVYGKGASYSPPYGIHTAQVGSAAGSTGLELSSQSSLAPIIQAG